MTTRPERNMSCQFYRSLKDLVEALEYFGIGGDGIEITFSATEYAKLNSQYFYDIGSVEGKNIWYGVQAKARPVTEKERTLSLMQAIGGK